MYIVDGIAYTESPMKQLKINAFQILERRMLLVTFNNGERRLFNATKLTGPVFSLIDSDSAFATAALEDGVITWLNGRVNCAPEFMYEHSTACDDDPI